MPGVAIKLVPCTLKYLLSPAASVAVMGLLLDDETSNGTVSPAVVTAIATSPLYRGIAVR